MPITDPVVQRFRRTDQDRGEWLPLGSRWKTAASAGLVSHDVYHHLPDDQGRFAEEVASLGAEWYIDVQPIDKPFSTLTVEDLGRFERNTLDTLLNALDSKEENAFALAPCDAPALSLAEMNLFHLLADQVLEMLDESEDPRASVHEAFCERFVQRLLWGYAAAKARFPDQKAVRAGCKTLREDLAYLERSEVPIGHEVTVTLTGTTSVVSYADADGAYLAANPVIPAFMMHWCSYEHGYPAKEVSLHFSERDYAEYVQDHFREQDDYGTPEAECRMPRDEQSGLRKVYIRTPAFQQALQAGQALKLPLASLQTADYTPRDIPVF